MNGLLAVLKTLVRDAYDEYEWGASPLERLRGVVDPGRAEDNPNSLDPEQLRRFLKAYEERFPQTYAVAYFAFTTGMRMSELAGLEWRDIDFTKGSLTVQRAYVGGHLQRPKTKKSRRTIGLVDEQLEVLQKHRQELLSKQSPGFEKGCVFPAASGTRMLNGTIWVQFKLVGEDIGLPFKFSPHGARRTFNNLLRRQGVDRQVLRSLTGHSTEAMTGHYSTVGADEQKDAVGRVVDLVAQRMAQS